MGKKTVNFLELIPKRTREWEELENGRIAVKQPRFFNKLAKKLVEPFLKKPTVNVRLDEYGSFTWLLLDGTKRMSEIADEFNSEFNCTDGADRLQIFIKYLENCDMIEFTNLKELSDK